MASAEVHQPNEFAVPQAKAGANLASLTNSAIFNAGLTSPIFSKSVAQPSLDPKDQLKFSGFYGGRASGTFPVGLSSSGLINLASSRDALALGSMGLNGSGASFPTGIPMSFSGIFPFPPMPPMNLHGSTDGIAASPSSASGSATDVTSKPVAAEQGPEQQQQHHHHQQHHHQHQHQQQQQQQWKHASTESTSGQFNAFTPFFRSLKSTSVAAEQPMAFWKTGSNDLLCFNESFLTLIEVDPVQLQGGFRWTDLRVVDRESREVRLNDDAPNALKVIYEFGQQALAGTSRFAQVNFSFFCGSNKLKHIALTLVAMPVKDVVLWLIQELGVEKSTAPRPPIGASPDIRRAGKPPAETASAPNTPGTGRAAVPTAPATDPMERKLVKVPIRKKKPWDQNLVKFSLKKARKRSKRSASSRAAALAAAAEEQHEQESGSHEHDLSPELPAAAASASSSPAPVRPSPRASPRVAHQQKS